MIADWQAKGFDLTTDILPTLTERTKHKRTDPIRTWEYFTPAIAARHARRLALAAKAKSAGEAKPVARATQAEILARTADWINSDRYVPTSAVSNVMRDALLAAGLVAELWNMAMPPIYCPECGSSKAKWQRLVDRPCRSQDLPAFAGVSGDQNPTHNPLGPD